MAKPIAYTLTNDSISMVWDGKLMNIRRGAPNFLPVRQCLIEERWDDLSKHLTVKSSLEAWAKGRFTVEGENFYYDGQKIPEEINSRIVAMATAGMEPQPLFNFWERLAKNPSYRSVNQLYSFLKHSGIPITKDGRFLAYKGVRDDYKDVHSGKFDNSPKQIHRMPRNQISDDPNKACHVGFHVGSERYATAFGTKTVICIVDPEHVVCVPYDSDQEKMRVCEYEVVGLYSGQLPSELLMDDELVDQVIDRASNVVPLRSPEGEMEEEEWEEDEEDEEAETASTDSDEEEEMEEHEYDSLDANGLMSQPIELLRRYAALNLKIVGASKIPGGKASLVMKILEVRDE